MKDDYEQCWPVLGWRVHRGVFYADLFDMSTGRRWRRSELYAFARQLDEIRALPEAAIDR